MPRSCQSLPTPGRFEDTTMLIRLLLLVLMSWPLLAQPRTRDYCVTWSTTLVVDAAGITVQQPASGAKNVRGQSATVYASSECAFSIEKNGTAATETVLTPWVGRDDIPQTPAALAYSDSDVGAGSSGPRHVVPAGGTFPLSLRGVEMHGNGTAKNFTLRTETCSADLTFNICWEEW